MQNVLNDLRPWAWSHACISVDLIKGVVKMTVNQVKVANIILEYPKIRQSKPDTLRNRLQFGDYKYPGWRVVQSEVPISNVHVYSRILSDKEMIDFTGPAVCSQEGDYLNWNNIELELHGNTTLETVEKEKVCTSGSNQTELFLFTENFSWETCMDLCPMMQLHESIFFSSKKETEKLLKWATQIDSSITRIWSSFTDEENEGNWKDHYTKKDIESKDLFIQGEPNGGRTQNCLSIRKEGFHDIYCNDPSVILACVCSFSKKPILKLRGLHPKSILDTKYTLYQGKGLAFYGLKQTKIIYDKVKEVWEAKIIANPVIGIANPETGYSMILGKHSWRIMNDSKSCNDGNPYERVLKMTGCRDDQFTCNNGQCVLMLERCDQIAQCKDESDEFGCLIISMKTNYNKNIPPFSANTKAKISTSMTFLSINEISEISLTIDIKFTISLQWYETERITYHNLKHEQSSNVLSESEMNSLWTPFVIYTNTDDNEATKIAHKFKDIKTTMAVTREGNFTRAPMESVDEIEKFKVTLKRIFFNT